MEQYKPPGLIKKIYFKNLSFGDAPFKVENVWVEDEGEKHVLMEVHKLLCQMGLTVLAKRLSGLCSSQSDCGGFSLPLLSPRDTLIPSQPD